MKNTRYYLVCIDKTESTDEGVTRKRARGMIANVIMILDWKIIRYQENRVPAKDRSGTLWVVNEFQWLEEVYRFS